MIYLLFCTHTVVSLLGSIKIEVFSVLFLSGLLAKEFRGRECAFSGRFAKIGIGPFLRAILKNDKFE